MFPVIQTTEKDSFRSKADESHTDRRQKHGQPESHRTGAEKCRYRIAEERAKHVKRAMSNIRNPEHSQNQAQP